MGLFSKKDKTSPVPKTDNVSITLGVPVLDTMCSGTALCLLGIMGHPPFVPFYMAFRKGPYIHDNRNVICQEALDRGSTHVLFIDYDMQVPANTLQVLLSHDKDIVAAYYHLRKLPLIGTTKIKDPHKASGEITHTPMPKSLFECFATGTGCMLIRTEVFKHIEKPWFNVAYEKGPQDGLVGEDIWFCRQARNAGYKIWVDPNLPVKHLGEYPY